MKAYYDSKPLVLEAVGNGSFRYRYDIKEMHSFGEIEMTQWECEEVIVYQPITSNAITASVIADKYPQSYEQKLVNEYNASQNSMYSEEESKIHIDKYMAFLKDRMLLKAQVDKDCAELDIK